MRAGATILSELCEADLPTPFIFAPLQVPYDTQILLGGGAFASDLDYLGWLRRFAQALPAPYQLVIKPHPQHSYAPGVLEHLFQAAPQVRVLRGVETRALIEQAEAIVTLNSTVGFDALCLRESLCCCSVRRFTASASWSLLVILTRLKSRQRPLIRSRPAQRGFTAVCSGLS